MSKLTGAMDAPMLLAQEEQPLGEQDRRTRFEEVTMPHLPAAYNLARWLTRNDHDAEDVVQEAYLRAFNFFDGFHGDDARPWLLTIVRNTCLTWLKRNRADRPAVDAEKTLHLFTADGPEPDEGLRQAANRELVHQALNELPTEFREVVVLREMDGLAYKEIAAITGTAIGTVMSRLARGRKILRDKLVGRQTDGF
jgi:RNA polymerase sigma-70 factor (ECF subfamily)